MSRAYEPLLVYLVFLIVTNIAIMTQLASLSNSPYNNTDQRISPLDLDEFQLDDDPKNLYSTILVEIIGEYPNAQITYKGRVFKERSGSGKTFYTSDYMEQE